MLRALLGLFVSTLLLAGAPRRVVSQALGTDELLLALADPAQIAALSHLATDPKFSPVVQEASAHPRLRDSAAESVLAHRPDLVLMASYTRAETRALLQRSGVKVLVLARFDTFEDLCANALTVGEALGRRARAERTVAAWRARAEALAARLKGAVPVRVIAPSTYGFLAGRDTTFDDVCRHAGALNVAAEAGLQGHAPTPSEAMLGWRVDALVISDDETGDIAARLAELPPYKFLAATKAKRFVRISGPAMSSISQARLDAYEQLARALHPERFR
ncbi:MAG: ABC transporter substrate-binding protein [Holophagaceae bacterium]